MMKMINDGNLLRVLSIIGFHSRNENIYFINLVEKLKLCHIFGQKTKENHMNPRFVSFKVTA